MKRLPYAERVIAVALLDLSGMVHAQQTEVVQLLASDGSSGDFFGHSVSIGGPAGAEIAIVGAHYDDDTSLFAGSVYIYNRNGDFWIQSQKLIASDGEASDLFGFSVSVSGSLGNEVAIIGSVFDDDNGNSSGSAYIFRKSGGLWIQEQKLLASDGDAFDNFGYSVSINEDLAIVGALRHQDGIISSGAAYIFRFDGDAWVEEATLMASDRSSGDHFGISVSNQAAPGNQVVIVGAQADDDNGTNSGSAYVYRMVDSIWVEEWKLLASDGASSDVFGQTVSIVGDFGSEVAIVGAYRDDDGGEDSGSAYVFRNDGLSWSEEAKLLASDQAPGDNFGISVDIAGPIGNEVVIVGAWKDADNGFDSGSAYLYRRSGSQWVEEAKLIASDGAMEDDFGIPVAISGTPGAEIALVAARRHDQGGTDAGAVYVFDASEPCPADVDDSDEVDVIDLLTLLSDWGPSPGSPADINFDNVVDVIDLLALLAAWGDC